MSIGEMRADALRKYPAPPGWGARCVAILRGNGGDFTAKIEDVDGLTRVELERLLGLEAQANGETRRRSA